MGRNPLPRVKMGFSVSGGGHYPVIGGELHTRSVNPGVFAGPTLSAGSSIVQN